MFVVAPAVEVPSVALLTVSCPTALAPAGTNNPATIEATPAHTEIFLAKRK